MLFAPQEYVFPILSYISTKMWKRRGSPVISLDTDEIILTTCNDKTVVIYTFLSTGQENHVLDGRRLKKISESY